MALQRGSYGIEFDERQGLPFGKFWGVAALVLLGVLGTVFFRGCAGEPATEPGAEGGVGQTRYRLPEEPEPDKPERLSMWRHFLSSRQKAAAAAAEGVGGEAPGDVHAGGSSPADAKRAALAKVQSPEVRKLLEKAAEHESADDLVNARLVLQEIRLRPDADDVRAFVERKIGGINTTLVFGDRAMPEKARHRIASGDLIGKLAKRYGNTQDYLLKANGIDKPELLRIGREIWVLQAPSFELTVFKRASSAVLTLNNHFFKRYEIGLCKPEYAPTGTYLIRNRVKKPSYRAPQQGEVEFGDPQNILGTRWVTLSATGDTPEVKGLGLHGTWNDALLGRISDEGRIRFSNADIEELCTLMTDGSAVYIAE
jgi:LysM repeat protein